MDRSDEGELVRRAAAGDVRAFEILVDRHYADCLRYATRMLGERADAEEAVQDAFVRAYRALGRYEDRGRFRGWLFRILINRCRTTARRRRRRWTRLEGYEARSPRGVARSSSGSGSTRREVEGEFGGEVGEGAGETEARIAGALMELGSDYREAFLLKYVEEMSYEEMSALTGAGVSALKMRVKRARDQLAERLGDLADE